MDCNIQAWLQTSIETTGEELLRLSNRMDDKEKTFEFDPEDFRIFEIVSILIKDHYRGILDEVGTAVTNQDWKDLEKQMKELNLLHSTFMKYWQRVCLAIK